MGISARISLQKPSNEQEWLDLGVEYYNSRAYIHYQNGAFPCVGV